MKTITIDDLKKQFDECEKIKVFEFEAHDHRTGTPEILDFWIEFEGDRLVATHAPLTRDQLNSDKIAFESVDIDTTYSLDEILAYLYEICANAIICSDFFTLID